jgi:glycosyltransferase involved in cell wall biosynthesis
VSAPAILHVISGLGIGGAEASLVQVVTALQMRGMQQHVVCIGTIDDHVEELKAHGVAVTLLGVNAAMHLPGGVVRMGRLVRLLDPGVVQGWMYHGNILASLAHRFAGRRNRRRLFWNLRASNVDAARYGRVVRFGAWLSRWPDVVIANSQAGAKFHADQGFRPRRIEVVGNGIDTQKFQPDLNARAALRAELDIPSDAVVVIHAARLDPMKDHPTLLAAMAAVPHVRGLLVGAGTETLDLPENVRALGLRRDLARLYAASDIVVSSSAFGEGFSNAIAEGMSVGLIPIATDVGDAREIVGDAGTIVAPGGAAQLGAALAAAASGPAAGRLSRGERARARIVERFPLAGTIDAYARIYELNGAASSSSTTAQLSAL